VHEETPSATAWRVALRRAAHQVFDDPRVFDDPLALRIVGADSDGTSPDAFFENGAEQSRVSTALRAFMAVRSRLAEDELAIAVERGVRQYVVLGAGLDTFAYRNPFGSAVRVFEVDHPATQAWKRTLLDRAGIAAPNSLTFVSVDFERQTAFEALREAGFNPSAPAFVAWLGVTMYLVEDTVWSVLRTIASLPPGSGVVFDYALSPSLLGPLERVVLAGFRKRVARAGEPWTTFFAPAALESALHGFGFRDVRDLGPGEINAIYFSGRHDGLTVGSLAHLMRASA
jgi:methyltransferase (TIGR00027 family)